ncbi:lamin tail domain-containing protein [Saccharopolyspora spinosa]|uniref:Lamin tail-like protein n=1 Tax=Saccharopolyspora spinosa TaxID=60894 RepID=A0A2N3Y8X3_SACSN|nr:lamin tail domain-containing protein [Saccharopolyspora spinosa]PKW19331.1 lamin tail-like protein [Saccharopolyspora spinosa]
MSTATTSGTWSSISLPATEASGLDTEHVTWGDGGSGYEFRGGRVDMRLDGQEFTLGIFTHQNFPTTPMSSNQFDVDLKVEVEFDDGTKGDFSFRFHHFETPNDSAAPADLVDLPAFVSPETVKVNGAEYAVVISGFKQDGQIVRQFKSPENGSNSAHVIAMFSRMGKPDVVVTEVVYKGKLKGTQADQYVEIQNRGTVSAEMSGWVLGADAPGQDFAFPPETVLQPGQRIRVYTNEMHPGYGGFSYGSKRPIWNDKGDVARLRDANGHYVSDLAYGDEALVGVKRTDR